MAQRNRSVVFARLNRRPRLDSAAAVGAQQPAVKEVALRLAEDGQARWVTEDREWVALDLAVDSSESFLTGTIGLSRDQITLLNDDQATTWAKAPEQTNRGARRGSIAPFAMDLREGNRWVAFAPAAFRATSFAWGLSVALTETVQSRALDSSYWDIDVITSRRNVREWVIDHPQVKKFKRTVKRPNPSRDISEDLAEMNSLRAGAKVEEFRAQRGGTLNVVNIDGELTNEFKGLLEGTDYGYVQIAMESRGRVGDYKFNADGNSDQTFVEDFGGDLDAGMSVVLDALREYVDMRSGH